MAVDVLARWTEVVQRPEPDVPLAEAALLISAAANPGLDVAGQLGRLDELATRAAQPDAAAVCEVLFDQLGLRGDRRTYGDPANSFLDRVIERRLGIPISLSVLLIEVAARCGVRLEGVGMPGHFLVRDPESPDRLIDAFGRGRRLSLAECEQLMRMTTGSQADLDPTMLAPTGSHAILARMLANLDGAFHQRGDTGSVIWVSELRARLPGGPVGDRVQLAARLAGLGRFDAAAGVLDDTARAMPAGPARDRVAGEAVTLRARMN